MTDAPALRFGVVAGAPASGAAWTDTARRVERLGFDLLLVPDSAWTPSPFPALAAAAAVTARLRLATWVLAAPLRTPGAVVREARALQLLADGRLEVGLGTGRPDAAGEAQQLGARWGSPGERLGQVLADIDALRREVEPPPPVIVAAAGPRALAAAGRYADTAALALPPTATVEEVRGTVERVLAHGAPEIALQLAGVGARWVRYLERQGVPEGAADLAAAFLRGSPRAMAEQLRELAATTGVTCFPVAEEHVDAFAPVLALLR